MWPANQSLNPRPTTSVVSVPRRKLNSGNPLFLGKRQILGNSKGGNVRRGGVLAVASEVSNSRKGSLAMTDSLTKKTQPVNIPFLEPSPFTIPKSLWQLLRQPLQEFCGRAIFHRPESSPLSGRLRRQPVSQPQSITQKGVHTDPLTTREREHWFLQHV